MESKIKEKLCSEQTRSCNVQGCPVNYQWAAWTMWTACSVSCDQGSKNRVRSCSPAENGGEQCPENTKENLKLYRQQELCSRTDCDSEYMDTFYYVWLHLQWLDQFGLAFHMYLHINGGSYYYYNY